MTTSEVERRRLLHDAAYETLLIPYCSLIPTPAQARFLLDMSSEALYGGAAGSAKSTGMLMAALQFADIPGHRALILRRTLVELRASGGLIDLAHQHLDRPTRWNAETSTFTFGSGASLTFGHLDHENDKLRYQGLEYQCVCFDELTHFTESQYLYLFSRLRRPAGDSPLARVPLRMRAATNPGGPGHDWVFRRFIQPWQDRIANGPRFFPARLADNPHIDQTSYRSSLERLDPITRAQLRDGDWDIRPQGRMFQADWFDIIEPHHQPERPQLVRYWDLASTPKTPGNDPDYTVGALVAYDRHTKTYTIIDIQRLRDTPGNIERHVRHTAERDGRAIPIYIEEEPGSAGKALIDHYRTTVLNGYTVRGDRPTGNKVIRAQPLASRAEHHEIRLVRGTWNQAFLDEAVLFPDGDHDDQIDAVAAATTILASRPQHPVIAPGGATRENPWKL